jgi:oligopeptide/dipeptide ABC transporter ATP-binding protein
MGKLLEVKCLRTYFYTDDGVSKAVDDVSFEVDEGHTIGIVGESGCGKSVSCLSVMRLIQTPPGKIAGGEVWFKGRNLLELDDSEMRKIRGNAISMIFQEPMTSLNPVFTCGDQIMETLILHQHMTKEQAKKRAIEMLHQVGIPGPEQRVNEYPHQLSGGMRQRVMIAMALSCNPALLFADEPTTALDVTVQAQILDLLRELQKRFNMAIVVITHDLGVVAEMAERVVVMYAGKVQEDSDVRTIYKDPLHPYTLGLQKAIPRVHQDTGRLYVIEGTVPNPLDFPPGCKFHPRCPEVMDKCRIQEPQLISVIPGHKVRCWLHQ